MKNKSLFLILLSAFLFIIQIDAEERKKYNFDSDWLLQIGDIAGAEKNNFNDSNWEKITLPRAFNEDEAFKVSIDKLTDTVAWHRKHFRIPEFKDGMKVFIEFEGIRQVGKFYLNGHYLGKHENGFLFTFDDIVFKAGKLEAISYDDASNEWNRYALFTMGEPAGLKFAALQNSEGFHADGADMVLVQVEVVDKNDNRCPLDNCTVSFRL